MSRGQAFYTVTFYLLVAMLFISVSICVWVAWCFKNDSFPFLWPIKFVRVVVSFFFGMFYIAALNIYLVMLECEPDKYSGHWVHHVWHVGEGHVRAACTCVPSCIALCGCTGAAVQACQCACCWGGGLRKDGVGVAGWGGMGGAGRAGLHGRGVRGAAASAPACRITGNVGMGRCSCVRRNTAHAQVH